MKTVFAKLGLACALGSAVLCAHTHAADNARVLNIYNRPGYIAEDTLRNFESETGIQVRYDSKSSLEALQAKLQAGNSGYDLVVSGAAFAKTQIDAGLLQKLDRSKLDNWGNLDKGVLGQMAKVDPGNQYLVNWLWGYVTLGIRVDRVRAALGDTPLPENAWELLFDPQYASKLAKCGISVLDSAADVVPVALLYAGKDPYSEDAADYASAARLLKTIRPFVTRFVPAAKVREMGNGSTCLVMAYAGDIRTAASHGADTKNKKPVHIQTLVPKTGSVLVMDTVAIPKDASHRDNAHLFINYLLRPEVHAALSNQLSYANPNTASLKWVRKDLAEDKSIFLESSAMKSMVAPDALSQPLRKVQARTFAGFKSGR
jgi:putrescine transport system substrate-binding protein